MKTNIITLKPGDSILRNKNPRFIYSYKPPIQNSLSKRNLIHHLVGTPSELKFLRAEPLNFHLNLMVIESSLPEVFSALLLISFSQKQKFLVRLISILKDINPLNFNQASNQPYYELRIQNLLFLILQKDIVDSKPRDFSVPPPSINYQSLDIPWFEIKKIRSFLFEKIAIHCPLEEVSIYSNNESIESQNSSCLEIAIPLDLVVI